MLFRPPWMQKYPHEYLPHLIEMSEEQMALQAAGGLTDENIFKVTENTPNLLAPTFLNKTKLRNVDNLCCYIKYVMVDDELPAKNPSRTIIMIP